MAKRKFTDEQLSRILGECAADNLIPGGMVGWCPLTGGGCLNQAAFNEWHVKAAWDRSPDTAAWFDSCYEGALQSGVDPEWLLSELEGRGWA